jgi:hypothetical protein
VVGWRIPPSIAVVCRTQRELPATISACFGQFKQFRHNDLLIDPNSHFYLIGAPRWSWNTYKACMCGRSESFDGQDLIRMLSFWRSSNLFDSSVSWRDKEELAIEGEYSIAIRGNCLWPSLSRTLAFAATVVRPDQNIEMLILAAGDSADPAPRAPLVA